MKVLNDVRCYNNLSEICESGDLSLNFEGKLLVDEEGWFEGIVKNPYDVEKKDEFIFGVCHDNIAIELIKIGDAKEIDPVLYVCYREDNSHILNGEFMLLSSFNSETYGRSFMNFDRANYYDNNNTRNVGKEIEELQESINNFKNDNNINKLYEEALNNKTALSYNLYNKINKEDSVLLKTNYNYLKNKKLLLKRKAVLEDDLR